MEIHFQTRPRDIGQFNKYLLLDVPSVWKRYLRIELIIVQAAAVTGFALGRRWQWIVTAVLYASLAYPIVEFARIFLQNRRYFNRPKADLDCTYIITPEGLEIRLSSAQALYYWKAIVEIVDTGNHFYFMRSECSGFIIPKRAFSSAEEAQQFFNLAHEYWGR